MPPLVARWGHDSLACGLRGAPGTVGAGRAAEKLRPGSCNPTDMPDYHVNTIQRWLSIRHGTMIVLLSAWWGTLAFAHTADAEPAGDTGAQHEGPADVGAAETASPVVPPRIVYQTAVPYPEGADGDAVVVLLAVINVDGTVRSVTAESGEPRFRETAERTVAQWRFEPALREGSPVAARIKLEVAFHAPTKGGEAAQDSSPPDDAGGEAASPTPQASPAVSAIPAPASPAPIEVTVLGEKPAPMAVSLARTEVRQIPGTFGDPFRAIEILPGVTPIISGLPYFYVRGAPPGNVGYYLDGIRVPYLYHIAIGPSVIHPAMVDRVDLYSGGYPARFGRFAGGIVAAETAAPNPTLHGEASIRLYDAGALVEGGFADGRGTFLLGGRYSYTAALLSVLAKGVTLDYRDFQGRMSYNLTADDQISLVTFGAYDLIAQDSNGISTIGFGSEFYRGEVRWDRKLGAGGRLRTAVTAGFDQTAVGGERKAQNRLGGLRVELDQRFGHRLRLRAGLDGMLESYRVTNPIHGDPDDPDSRTFQALFPARRDATTGVHGELGIEIRPGFVVTPGVRLDYYRSAGAEAVAVDPRLSARLDLSSSVALVQSLGIAHQPPSFLLPIPGLALGSLSRGLQTAYQASVGVEWNLMMNTRLTSNLFYDIFTNMTDTLSLPERDTSDLSGRTSGRAYGFELFLHRKLTRDLGGFVSYTLSRSEREMNGQRFPSAFDRRHVLNAALALDLGRHWRAGTRVMWYTGAPKTSQAGATVSSSDAPVLTSAANPWVPNPPRDPSFWRLDLRLEKLWQLGETTHMSFVAEVLNATASKETLGGTAIGPVVVPSIGVEGGF